MDTERPGENDDATTDVTAGIDVSDSSDATGVAYADAAPKTRLLLGTLAGLGVVLLGIAAWAGLYAQANRDFPGIAVVGGLVIGYVVREVSRRSDVVARLVSAVLAALLCLFGALSAIAAYVIKETQEAEASDFFSQVKAYVPHAVDIINERYAPRAWLTWLIFLFAIGVAWFSTMPAKPKKAAAPAAPAAPAGDSYASDE